MTTCIPHCKKQSSSLSIALVGNPNCGKTTLFNALTGARQHVGNWPGVTVERKSGFFIQQGTIVEIVDLPGVYSLDSEAAAIDECVALDYILKTKSHVMINIVDASHLERHLYLTLQLIEMGAPIILALNMMDVARSRQIHIDIAQLSRELGCPVIALEANKGDGVAALTQAVLQYEQANTKQRLVDANLPECDEEKDIVLAEARYRAIEHILQQSVSHAAHVKTNWTSRIDHIVLNRVLGIPIFLGMMYLLFVVTINVGGALQAFFNTFSQTIFVDGLAYVLTQLHAPAWLIALLANGIGKGINTTITFIPVIGSLFLCLAFLEDSGYMARAAFVIDRLMRALGLPGKAFVPMIVGFGCNVPAVLGARTLENKRDRILTIMMIPFMSCGARLAIFAVFTSAFFPKGGQNIVFALYLIGIVMAVLTGFLLRRTVLKGDVAPLVMELPAYHVPRVKTLWLHAWQRLKSFVFRAGKLIVPICMLIGALNSLNVDGSMNTGEGDVHSLLSILGQWFTPLFAPMGIQADNWPATVGLVTGVLAKEVVVGTLNTLYSQMGHVAAGGDVYGIMYQQFDGQVGAFAYLLFVLLYFPCISTMAVMLRELHRGWSIFSGLWMTGVAYGAAVTFYQAATLLRHPLSSLLWIAAIAGIFFGTVIVIRLLPSSLIKETESRPIRVGCEGCFMGCRKLKKA